MEKTKSGTVRVLCIVAAVFSTLSLHCRWGLYESAESGIILNLLQKFGGAFQSIDFLDIIVLVALSAFYIKILYSCGFDFSAVVISCILSALYIICRQYRDYNSLQFLFDSKFSLLITIVGFIGYACLIYATFVFAKDKIFIQSESENGGGFFFNRFFWPIAWVFIFACYLPWILLSYPGSGMPDTVIQFKNYLGEIPWSMWQPPLSSLIMGWCYSLGKLTVSADFGFFLYTLLQTVAASGIFAYSVNRLKKLGVSMRFCILSILFYGLVPMWGGFAQWVEKDLLFAVVTVLFSTFIAEVYVKKDMGVKEVLKIVISGILLMFLRNNGVYAVIPALAILCFYISRAARRSIVIIVLALLVTYEGATRLLFPAVGVGDTSISESIGFMFQQTARYVNNFPDELSDTEKAVLVKNFQSIETFDNYNPKFMDPVKIYYNHSTPKEYFTLWFKHFTKHPAVYVEAYLNGAYGYIAPVEGDTGAYINADYDNYYKDTLGVGLKYSKTGKDMLIAVLNPSKYLPVIKYFTYPGAYTWWLVLCLYVSVRKKKKGAWCVFAPAVITVLVCTVSPLACATRYALPVAACAPLLAGWTMISGNENSEG